MRKPRPGIVISVLLPFLTACFHTQVQPLPEPDARHAIQIHGVVLNGVGDGERIEYERVDAVEWTDSTVVLTGVRKPASSNAMAGTEAVSTRSFQLTSVSGVLVRQVDASTTSVIIAAVTVGAIAVATLLLTGKTDDETILGIRPVTR